VAYAYAHRLFEAPFTWWSFALAFVLEDLRYYWWHRISHRSRWFWASHVVHHSSQHFNLSTNLATRARGIDTAGQSVRHLMAADFWMSASCFLTSWP
jgi:sterol desaturase/sphingolipid hydroxylase (fatty acid hydroxylase superfamily)